MEKIAQCLEVKTRSVMKGGRQLSLFKDIALACQGDTLSLNASVISDIETVCDQNSRKLVNINFQRVSDRLQRYMSHI